MKCLQEKKLKFFIKKLKIKNILVITGKKSFNNSGFKNLEIFNNFKSTINIFYKKNKIPDINELELLIKKINILNPDLIIAVGGGCAIDYAKLANGLYNIKNLKNKIIENKIRISSKKTKLLAIPTTAGSGAEVTQFSVIYINNVKYSVEHNLLKPDFYCLIPNLTLNTSKIVRASSAFDAIAQASESIFSKRANVYSLVYSLRSLQLSIKSFVGFVNSPNFYNAKRMLNAANLSGKAINIAKTNAPHAFSYFFSSRFKVPHGIAVSIFFTEIINIYHCALNKKNSLKLKNKFNFFFKSIKVKNILEFNSLFDNFFLESGIKKYLEKFFKKKSIYKNNIRLHYNSDRLKNYPIKISSKDINNLYLNKFNF
jgi:alcohol dehydrogenase class IV